MRSPFPMSDDAKFLAGSVVLYLVAVVAGVVGPQHWMFSALLGLPIIYAWLYWKWPESFGMTKARVGPELHEDDKKRVSSAVRSTFSLQAMNAAFAVGFVLPDPSAAYPANPDTGRREGSQMMLRRWFSYEHARDRREFVRVALLTSLMTLFIVALTILAPPNLIWTLAVPWWVMVVVHPELVRRRNARHAKRDGGR